MDRFELLEVITLPVANSPDFRSCAFDGEFYYFTSTRERAVYKFTRGFFPAGYAKTAESYTGICYDSTDGCFWASVENHHPAIHRLDSEFRHVGVIDIMGVPSGPDESSMQIMGISYDAENDLLLVAFEHCVCTVCKKSGRAQVLLEAGEDGFAGVLSLPPYYAVIPQNRREIRFYANGGCVPWRIKTPQNYMILDTLPYPLREQSGRIPELLALAAKRGERVLVLVYDLNGLALL